MAYPDQKFYAKVMTFVSPATSWGTATASSTVGCDLSNNIYLPKFFNRCAINKVRMRCTVIPDNGSTAVKAHFLNGTDTFAVVTLTTATAYGCYDGTVNTAYNTLTASTQPTVKTTGTATASADAMGSYEVWFEVQELPSTA